jgi:endonuclease/exonuclease/phosphatase family metal-dependent hydrolase
VVSKKDFSILNIIFLIINILSIILLIMSYLSNYIKPTTSFWVAFCGLAYPYILIINVLFVIIWLFRKKRYAFFTLAVILFGFSSLHRLYKFKGTALPSDTTQTFSVMSYNVQAFGGFDYQKKSQIEDHIRQKCPDIVCIQEYWQKKSAKNKKDTLKYPYSVLYLPLVKDKNEYGMALYSIYPIVNQGHIEFSNSKGNFAHYVDVLLEEDTVRIYNIHLQSIHLGKKDYQFANEILVNHFWQEPIKSNSKRILRKVKNGMDKRISQTDTLIKHIQQSPHKVIVCGDFNDTPWSYTYRKFSQHLNDSFVKSGKGFGNTMKINKLFSFRIDYVFCDPLFESYAFAVDTLNASDHFPVSVHLKKNIKKLIL